MSERIEDLIKERRELLKVIEERRGQMQKNIERGKSVGAKLFDEQNMESLSAAELNKRLREVQGSHSQEFARGVWYGYIERGAEVFEQEQEKQK